MIVFALFSSGRITIAGPGGRTGCAASFHRSPLTSVEIDHAKTVSTMSDAARPFMGPRIVAVSFFGSLATYGVIMAVVGNFVGPIGATFSVPPTTIGLSLGILTLILGVLGPLVGRAIDSGHTRVMMALGAAVVGCGLLLLARATTFTQLVLCFLCLVAPGLAFCGHIATAGLITSWYRRNRGLMMGLALTGPTFAMWIGPFFVESIMQVADWRTAMSALGAVILVVVAPLYGWLLVARPEFAGQAPDGKPQSAEPESGEALDQGAAAHDGELAALGTTDLLKMPGLWIASLGLGLLLTSGAVLIPLLIRYAETGLGIEPIKAVHFYLVMIPFSILGKITIGRVADIAPLKPVLAVAVLLNLLVWAVLYLEPGYALFLVTGAIYGLGFGGLPPLQQFLMGRLFGRANFGRASGIGGVMVMLLVAGANFGSQGYLGATGSYAHAFVAQMAVIALGGALLASLKIPNPTSPARIPTNG